MQVHTSSIGSEAVEGAILLLSLPQAGHSSPLELAEAVEQGLPIGSIDILRKHGVTFSEVHSIIIPARTLKHRAVKKQALSVEETDRTLRMAKVLDLADRVFANHEKALRWLRGPNKRLEGRSPIELLRSEVGGELVRTMLHQLDEGMVV